MAENEILSELNDQDNAGESDLKVTENPDGSADVIQQLPRKPAPNKDFYRNLVDDMDPDDLETISNSLLEMIEKDRTARERRDEQVEEGKKRMGLDKETLGGANFTGASNVVHPMYTKASIDFEARSIKELFPPGGPVREYLAGSVTDDRTDRARRKARWMNYQLTQLMPCFRAELEQVLINLPMDGNAYQKFIPPGPNGDIRDVGHEWIPVDKMLLPYAATNFYRAERRTHVQDLTAQEFDRRVRSGMYVDVDSRMPVEPEGTKTEAVVAKIEGKESDQTNPDGLRVVYECDCLFEVKDPDVKGSRTEGLQQDADGTGEEDEAQEVGPLPYLISIDETTKEVVAIYRNWDEHDDQRKRFEWTVEWCFIPFRGAYALGLPHIIGGLSIAATGALRALLDTAHINNIPGLVKLKGAGGTGQNIQVSPTEITELANSGEIDDVRKLIMPLPFKEPSPVLLTLLGLLGDQAEQVIRTTIEESESNGDVPVGTTLARIEQGMVAFSAIHGRLHDSMDRLLKVLHRINATWMEDDVVEDILGEQLVTKEDFTDGTDVIPVSDPNIFCEVQRYGQIQMVGQRAMMLAGAGIQIYDNRKVEELILKQMKLPNDGKDLLIQKPEPTQLNPVNENVALALGRPIVAFPQQDHDAHIQAHCDFYESPFFQQIVGSNLPAIQGLLQNLKEHTIFWYATKVHELASREATSAAKERDPKSGKVDIGDLPQQSDEDPEIAQLYDRMLASASANVMQMAQKDQGLQRASQTIQQLQQLLQKMQPPPPMDPTQAAMADVQRQAQADQNKDKQETAKNQTAQAAVQEKAQANQASNAAKQQIAAQQQQAETQRREQENMVKQITNREDNQTALQIESAKLAAGHVEKVMDQQQADRELQVGHQEKVADQQHAQNQLDQSREQAQMSHEAALKGQETTLKVAKMKPKPKPAGAKKDGK